MHLTVAVVSLVVIIMNENRGSEVEREADSRHFSLG